jgi:hypothetical protein
MKIWMLTICILSFSMTIYAFPVLQALNYILPAPPKTDDAKTTYYYLNTLYSRWNTLQITTQEPNGNVTGNYGQLIIYNNSGTYFLAVETKTPNGAVWKGITLGAI